MFEQHQKPNQEEEPNMPNKVGGQSVDGVDDLLQGTEGPSSPKKKLIIIVVIVFGVILISGGLLFAAQKVFDFEIPLVGKFFKQKTVDKIVNKETPEDVIKKMFLSFENIKTSHENLSLKITDGDKVVNIELKGKRDFTDAQNRKLDYIFSSESSSNAKLSLDFKYLDETVYVNLLEVPMTPFVDLSLFKNQWFYLDKQDRGELSQLGGGSGVDNIESQGEYDQDILEIFKKAKLFNIVQVFEDEGNLFHYSVALDKEGFLAFFDELEKVGQDKLKSQNLPISFPQERLDDMKKTLDEMKDVSIEVWVEKGSYFLRKMVIDYSGMDIKKNNQTSKVDVLLNLELNEINQPVDVEAPLGGQSLGEVIQGIFGGWMQDMPLLKQDDMGFKMEEFGISDSDQDNDNLTDEEEVFYNTDPLNPDTDGDGYLDGDEVMNGYNPNGEGELLMNVASAKNFSSSRSTPQITIEKATAALDNQDIYSFLFYVVSYEQNSMKEKLDSLLQLGQPGQVAIQQLSDSLKNAVIIEQTDDYIKLENKLSIPPNDDMKTIYFEMDFEDGLWKIAGL